MHPWQKHYRVPDLYTQDQLDQMKYMWHSKEELDAKEEYDKAWAEIHRNVQIILDAMKQMAEEAKESKKKPTNKDI